MNNVREQKTYVCKRARMCSFLIEKGFTPYKVAPDRDNPMYDVFLFTASPELYQAVMEYINTRSTEEKTLNVRVAIRVKGGLVQTVYSNSDVDVDVYDLDVSDFPDEGEAEEADRKEKELDALCNNSGWRAVW